MRRRWINRIAIAGVILLTLTGGLWLWDAKNYPIYYLDGLPNDPFARASKLTWNVDQSFVANIHINRQWLRNRKAIRLHQKWMRNLGFEDSYWTSENDPESDGTTIVHFSKTGDVEARNQLGLPASFKGVSGYRHPQDDIVIFEFDSGSETESFAIAASDENFFVLNSITKGRVIFLQRMPDSSDFDSLPKTAE